MRHIQGESRFQTTLFPDRLEDYVSEDNPVRVIDAFIDGLDMAELGFMYANPKETGRKPYDPGDLLKLYIYGYLNQVRSTRRLEKECHRNLDVLWLLKKLAPDFKTIANFRKENSQAIREVCRTFIQFCREAHLLTGALIALDGSKFRAAASPDQVISRQQLNAHRDRLDQRIESYLEELEETDQDEAPSELDTDRVKEALERLRSQRDKLNQVETQMDERRTDQYCQTEPSAKRMRSGREGMIVGYNIQSTVDAETGLIVHHDVTDESNDRRQLQPMAEAAKSILQLNALTLVADSGYSNGEQIAACEEQQIEVAVPVKRGVNNRGGYQKEDSWNEMCLSALQEKS